jgi:hypothetical protein
MLQNREPAELLDDVRSFARRKPGLFLLGAAAAGVLAGRLTSGVKAAHSSSYSSGNGGSAGYGSAGYGSAGYAAPQTNYVDPAPTYSDYTATTDYPATTDYTGTTGTSVGTTPGTGTPLPPPPYGQVPPAGGVG